MRDFPGARKKDQGIDSRIRCQRFGVCCGGGVCHVVQEPTAHAPRVQPRHSGRRPLGFQGVQRGRTVDDGSRGAAVVRRVLSSR
ncbi:hypothetical protein D9M68_977690 [compost metagenome]